MPGRVLVSLQDSVALVTLNRPEKHNAVDLDMFAALAEVGRQLAHDHSVRAVVLTGSGPSFCAGIDLGVFNELGAGIGASKMFPGENTPANFFQHAAYVWREVPVPVICAMHGNVFGAGLQIALGADLRLASPDCRLSIMEIKWGIIPDMAISKTLPAGVPVDRIKELALTGRIVSGVEGHALGLVTTLHDDPLEAAGDAARLIAGRSPDAVRAIKRLFNESAAMSTADALRLEARLQIALLSGANQAEAVLANMENRDPRFSDPTE